jgi:hypothetical protein
MLLRATKTRIKKAQEGSAVRKDLPSSNQGHAPAQCRRCVTHLKSGALSAVEVENKVDGIVSLRSQGTNKLLQNNGGIHTSAAYQPVGFGGNASCWVFEIASTGAKY